MNDPALILYLEDNPHDAELVRDKLQQSSRACEVRVARDRAEYEAAMAETRFDLILSDYALPDYDGMAALALARGKQPDVPFILISGTLGEERAVDCMVRGATDYVLKQRMERLVPAVLRTLTEAEEHQRRRETEEALRQSEERFRILFEQAADCVLLLEIAPDGIPVIRNANSATFTLLGYERDELIGQPVSSIEAAPDASKVVEKRPRDVLSGIAIASPASSRGKIFEARRRRKDGTLLDFECSVTEMQIGAKTLVLSVERDISARKREENHIRRLNRVYAMLSNVDKAIVRIREPNALFGEVCRIAVDEGGFRMAWIGLANPTGGRISPMAHAGVPDHYLEQQDTVLGDDARDHGPTGIAMRTGKRVVCNDMENDPHMAPWREDALRNGYRSSATFPLNAPGGVRGIFSLYATDSGFFDYDEIALLDELAMDIGFAMEFADKEAERKQAEEALRLAHDGLEQRVRERTEELHLAKQVAEKANHAKSDFLASMSHELRTPLGAIIGFSELLEEKIFGDLNPKQEEYIKDILESGRHLLSLINDILDLAKIESGKTELELSAFPIATLLDNSLVMVKEKCLKHGIDLTTDIADGVKDLIMLADERKMKQVMFNLLSNAVKFTPDGGQIRVSANLANAERGTGNAEQGRNATDLNPDGPTSESSAFRVPPSALLVSISDTGIGVASEHQSRLFREFYQVNAGGKGKTPGTGLGLALVKRMVEQHGGRVWMESPSTVLRAGEGEGKGCTFRFTIPLSPPHGLV